MTTLAALRCRTCGAPAGLEIGPECVAFTCARCVVSGRLAPAAALARPLTARRMDDPEPDGPDVPPGTETLICSARSVAGRQVEMWQARGAYQGAQAYFAVLGYRVDGVRHRQARYTPFAVRAEALYRALLNDADMAPVETLVAAAAPIQDTPWPALRASILRRDGRKCRRCRSTAHLTVHHIMPRSDGGSDSPANLLTLCTPCHDWAEIETAERGLSWSELIAPPEGA